MQHRPIFINRILLAWLITTVLFILIFSFAYSVSYLNYRSIEEESNLIEHYINDLDLIASEGNSCNDTLLFDASQKLDTVGSKLALLETRFGNDDPRVLEQKRRYSELEMKHFELVKQIDVNCERDFLTILFFYSNGREDGDNSEQVGFILSTFKNQDSDKIMVYSFDYNLDADAVRNLANRYGVESAPVVIVNERDYLQVSNIRELEKYL